MSIAMATTKADYKQSSWDSFQMFDKALSKDEYTMLPRISKDNLPSQDMLASKHAPQSLKIHVAQQKIESNKATPQLVSKNKTIPTNQNIPESQKVVSEVVITNKNSVKQPHPNKPEVGKPKNMSQETLQVLQKTDNKKVSNRFVMISFLPWQYTVTHLLQLVEPNKNTLIVESYITSSGTGIIGFCDERGAVSVLNQFHNGIVPIYAQDSDLGEIRGSATIKPAPEKYDEELPSTIKLQIEKKGATRVLKITSGEKDTKGRKQWTEEDYKKLLETEVENVSITFEDSNETVVIRFLRIAEAITARMKFLLHKDFSLSAIEYGNDPCVLSK